MFDYCIYFNTTALARQLEKEWTKAFARFALTPPQAFLLRAILDRPGSIQRELAAFLAISKATATRALDGLAAKGMVERRVSARDGREVSIHPTAAAIALRGPLNEASGKVTRRLKKVLGEEAFAGTVLKIRAVRSVVE